MTEGADPALRIAIIAPPWFEIPPGGYGGIENVVAVLAAKFTDLGHRVVLIGSGRAQTPAQFRQTLHVPPSERLTDVVPEILHAAITADILDGLDVDVIHDHSLAGPLVTTRRAVPAVVTAHYPPVGDRALLLERLGRRAALTALSRAQCALAPAVNWAAVVPNPVDVASFPYVEAKSGYALYLGRLARIKQTHLAIDAARAAGLPLLIAGPVNDPGELEYLQAEIIPRLGPDVELLGPVDQQAKRSLLAGAACLLFPSLRQEPFGLVMIEAMACGTPVVAFADGPAAEIVADGVTGILASQPEDLAGALIQAAALRPADCRQHASTCFDVTPVAERYLAVYRDAMKDADLPRFGCVTALADQ